MIWLVKKHFWHIKQRYHSIVEHILEKKQWINHTKLKIQKVQYCLHEDWRWPTHLSCCFVSWNFKICHFQYFLLLFDWEFYHFRHGSVTIIQYSFRIVLLTSQCFLKLIIFNTTILFTIKDFFVKKCWLLCKNIYLDDNSLPFTL